MKIKLYLFLILITILSTYFIKNPLINYSLLLFILIIGIILIFSYLLKERDKKIKKQDSIIYELYELTDNVNYPLCLIDSNDTITYANKEFINLFGKNVNSKNIYSVLPNIENDIIEFEKKIFQKEIFINNKGYKKLFLLDISEKIKIDNLRKEFSANVSHELKTPLTTVIGYAELLSLNMVEKDKIQEVSKKIYLQAQDLLELLEDIIKISKLEDRNFNDLKEEIDVGEIIENEISIFSEKIKENNLAVEYTKYSNYLILANKITIKEIVHNLLSNAIKYNNHLKIIKIEIFSDNFSIENSSSHFSEVEKSRIFERFYRGEKSRSKNINGNGLGLSIVKHAILLNNGKIQVDNTDIGVKFSVFI